MTKQQLLKSIKELGLTVTSYNYVAKDQEVEINIEGYEYILSAKTKESLLRKVKSYKVPSEILEAVELAKEFKRTRHTKLSVDELSDKMFFEGLCAVDAA